MAAERSNSTEKLCNDGQKPKGRREVESPRMKGLKPYLSIGYWGARFTYALMAFLGLALNFACRVDLSVAIIAMTNTSKDIRIFL